MSFFLEVTSASDKRDQRPILRPQHMITHRMRCPQLYVYFTKTVMAMLPTVGPTGFPHALDPESDAAVQFIRLATASGADGGAVVVRCFKMPCAVADGLMFCFLRGNFSIG